MKSTIIGLFFSRWFNTRTAFPAADVVVGFVEVVVEIVTVLTSGVDGGARQSNSVQGQPAGHFSSF